MSGAAGNIYFYLSAMQEQYPVFTPMVHNLLVNLKRRLVSVMHYSI